MYNLCKYKMMSTNHNVMEHYVNDEPESDSAIDVSFRCCQREMSAVF